MLSYNFIYPPTQRGSSYLNCGLDLEIYQLGSIHFMDYLNLKQKSHVYV